MTSGEAKVILLEGFVAKTVGESKTEDAHGKMLYTFDILKLKRQKKKMKAFRNFGCTSKEDRDSWVKAINVTSTMLKRKKESKRKRRGGDGGSMQRE